MQALKFKLEFKIPPSFANLWCPREQKKFLFGENLWFLHDNPLYLAWFPKEIGYFVKLSVIPPLITFEHTCQFQTHLKGRWVPGIVTSCKYHWTARRKEWAMKGWIHAARGREPSAAADSVWEGELASQHGQGSKEATGTQRTRVSRLFWWERQQLRVYTRPDCSGPAACEIHS